MAHELELDEQTGEHSIFYRQRETPWHKLGQAIPDDYKLSIEEGIKAAHLDWEVKLGDLYSKEGKIIEQGKYTYREKDNQEQVLGVVGPNYTPLQNIKAFEFFQPFLDSELCELDTAGSLRGGENVWVLARIKNGISEIVKDDAIERYLLLSNNHSGLSACRVSLTPIRVVCWNTLSMAHNSKSGSKFIRLKHTSKIEKNLEDVREIINLANNEFEATLEQYRLLTRKGISPADLRKYIKIILKTEEDDNQISTRMKNKIEEFEFLFEMGKGNNLPETKGTWWAAYNAVTEHFSHFSGRNKETRLNNLWFGPNQKLNQFALETAIGLSA